MNTYYVESSCGWFIVKCKNARQAKSEGVYEFGTSFLNVRLATKSEIEYFKSVKGESAMEPSIV